MDRELFVQNIERWCAVKGVAPTVACRESGAGNSFLTNVKRGQTPSVANVQLLAQYLGCTVSDLLGETPGALPAVPGRPHRAVSKVVLKPRRQSAERDRRRDAQEKKIKADSVDHRLTPFVQSLSKL